MRWGIPFKTSLSGKFLLSYLLIVLVGVTTLPAVTFALAPTLFQPSFCVFSRPIQPR